MNHAAPLAELIRRADVDLVMCAGRFTLSMTKRSPSCCRSPRSARSGSSPRGCTTPGCSARPGPYAGAIFDYEEAPPELVARVNRIADVCESHGVTVPDVAIAYVLRNPAVVSVVLGARGTHQVHSNVQRTQAQIPVALWQELVDEGLIADPV